jgi:DNA-binding NarL/FixJ family response regulator
MLSEREAEAEVLRLLGDGKATAEIAAKLKISLKTFQSYLQPAQTKAARSQPQPTRPNRGFVARGRC